MAATPQNMAMAPAGFKLVEADGSATHTFQEFLRWAWVRCGGGYGTKLGLQQTDGSVVQADGVVGAGTGISVSAGYPATVSLAAIASDRFLANIGAGAAAPVPTDFPAFVTHAGITFAAAGAGLAQAGSLPVTLSLATVANQRLLANISGGVAVPSANTLAGIMNAIFGAGVAGQYLGTGPGWTTSPYLSATLSANQAQATGVAAKIIFNTVESDSNGWYNNATGRYTPLLAGRYRVGVTVAQSGTTVTQVQTFIYKNGAPFKVSEMFFTGGTATLTCTASAIVQMNGSTDFIEGFAQITGGATNALGGSAPQLSWIDAEYLGP